ncbi:MAG: serine hydrolase domain-containing protein, partial [Pseudomonadota bacterium]
MRFICLFAVLLGSAQAAEHRELAAFLEDHLIESNAPSGAAAAMVDGNIVWTWASGYADIADREKATPATAYSIASVTKPVTAAAILQLVEKGRIDLDAPANQFLASPLSSAYGDSEQITVRMLLNHTSGLPRHVLDDSLKHTIARVRIVERLPWR